MPLTIFRIEFLAEFVLTLESRITYSIEIRIVSRRMILLWDTVTAGAENGTGTLSE